MSLKVGAQYKLAERLGCGAFGEIYAATNGLTGQKVAVKLEPVHAKHPQLEYEARVYERMSGKIGIPRVYYFGREGPHYILVMDRLGANLEDLFNRCNRRFSMQTTLLLADKMLSVLERVHAEGFIHRDLKPDNFLVGFPSNSGISDDAADKLLIYLVDFGLSKCFWNPDTDTHIPYRTGKSLTGTPRYASIRNHKGCEQSRRDDLESIGYILVYFVKGGLPWQNMAGVTKKARYKKMMETKENAFPDLVEGLPSEFKMYFKTIFSLEFTGTPKYKKLRDLFRAVYNRLEYSLESAHYDWSA